MAVIGAFDASFDGIAMGFCATAFGVGPFGIDTSHPCVGHAFVGIGAYRASATRDNRTFVVAIEAF